MKIVPYTSAVDTLQQLCESLSRGMYTLISMFIIAIYEDSRGRYILICDVDAQVWFDTRFCNLALLKAIGALATRDIPSPISMQKAIKNSAELDGLRKAHVKDGVALVTFLSRLEREMQSGP